MKAVKTRVLAFLAFWYDFVVGDDWTVALGVALAFGATYVLSRTSAPAWWLVPAAVITLLGLSLWRAVRPRED